MRMILYGIEIRDYFEEVVDSLYTPIQIQNLAGDIFMVKGWFTCSNFLTLVYEQHPELNGIDLFIDDKLVSESELKKSENTSNIWRRKYDCVSRRIRIKFNKLI